MIPLVPGWQRVVRADSVILRAIDRPAGEVRYREVYGPVKPIRRIVAERLAIAPLPGSTVVKLHDPERLNTIEGEWGAIQRLDLLVPETILRGAVTQQPVERPAVRMFGVTYADHFTTLIDGICLERDYFEEFVRIVYHLTRHTSLVLGTRRRRFVYKRPAGWQALATHYTTRYIPPEYPRDRAMITVYPALPLGPSHWYLESVISDVRERGAQVTQVEPEPITVAGMSGNRWRVVSKTDAVTTIHIPVILQDRQYLYRLRFDHAPDNVRSRPVFDALCESIERFPEPATSKPGSTFDHWAE